jgi:hypothetical protein
VDGAVVSVQQTRQAFKFGTAVTATYLVPSAADATSLQYQAIVKRLFNTATVGHDASKDTLTGSSGRNWFLYDPLLDRVTDR